MVNGLKSCSFRLLSEEMECLLSHTHELEKFTSTFPRRHLQIISDFFACGFLRNVHKPYIFWVSGMSKRMGPKNCWPLGAHPRVRGLVDPSKVSPSLITMQNFVDFSYRMA